MIPVMHRKKMELYKGQLKNYQFNIITKRKHDKKTGKNTRTSKCYDIFTFDLENTNAWIDENGNVINYRKWENDDYWNNLIPLSLVYIWQFSVNDTVYYGRDLIDFLELLNDLPQNCELQIFVHNLSHEFCFLRNILTVDTVFARAPHKPMKCTYKEYPLITFRCSYIMTNLSLANWGEQIGFNKKIGQLDYDAKIRTPLTDLTQLELEYAEYDCLVVYHGILKELEIYEDVFSIPLTSTGKVRKIVKERLFSNKNYSYWIKKQVPDFDEYQLLLKCFQGGYCHCSRYHSNKLIDDNYMSLFNLNENVISHFDFTSSYPTVLFFKYPVTRFRKRDTHNIAYGKSRDKYAFLYKLKFVNLKSINPNTYISYSKATINGDCIKDNGRVVSCYGDLIYYCTDVDFDIIKQLYTWDKLVVVDSWYAFKDYLPKEFLNYVLELYSDKTTLKGVKGKEEFYLLQKGRLNSLYGMCVTSLIPQNCTYNNGVWSMNIPSIDECNKKLSELSNTRKLYNHDYFCSFSWGVFCTAYARYNLFKVALCDDTENGFNCLYFDTDSIFCMGRPNYTPYNEYITQKLLECCNARGLDFEKTRPIDIKGNKRPLGIFDSEDDIKEFKCIHSKCYIEKRYDNNLYMTISGINKSAVKCLKDINDFSDGKIFDKDSEFVHKLISTYCDEQPIIKYPDGYISKYKYGKNLRSIGYKISITDEYEQLLSAYERCFDDFDTENITSFMKGII